MSKIEQLVGDADEAGTHRPLDDDDRSCLVHIQDRHPVDRAALVVACGRVDHVVRADNEHDVRLWELGG
jgi:hypothetical protein